MGECVSPNSHTQNYEIMKIPTGGPIEEKKEQGKGERERERERERKIKINSDRHTS